MVMNSPNKIRMEIRYINRFVTRLLSYFIKRQDCHCAEDIQGIKETLKKMECTIEIIGRQIARWAKINPGK